MIETGGNKFDKNNRHIYFLASNVKHAILNIDYTPNVLLAIN